MWNKSFEKAKWNNREINIISTGLERGRRLQINEFPNSDKATVDDLGASAEKIKIQIVFVGAQSLEEALSFKDFLVETPKGKLEHPFHGELDLHYESSSMSYTTNKQGAAIIDASFVADSEPTTITEFKAIATAQLTDAVAIESAELFVKEIEEASPDKIAEIQSEFGGLLNDLQKLADTMQIPGDKLNEIYSQVKSATTALTRIINAPKAFANQMLATLNGVSNQVKSLIDLAKSNISTPLIVSTSAERRYQQSLTETEAKAQTKHLKVLTTCAAINTNRYLLIAEEGNPTNDKIEKSLAEIDFLIEKLADRLEEATEEAEFESLKLIDAIQELEVEVIAKKNIVSAIQRTCKTEEVAHNAPLLAIAQELDANADTITALNEIKHPLFISGDLRYSKDA